MKELDKYVSLARVSMLQDTVDISREFEEFSMLTEIERLSKKDEYDNLKQRHDSLLKITDLLSKVDIELKKLRSLEKSSQ